MKTITLTKAIISIGCLLMSTQSFSATLSDVVNDNISFTYQIYNDTRTSTVSMGEKNGYGIFCSGLVFGKNTTANLIGYANFTRILNKIDLTSGKVIAKRKSLSTEECSALQVELESASVENPVSIKVENVNSFSINSK